MPPFLFPQFGDFRPRQKPLVATASESQGKVSLGLDKRPVDQSIHQVENAVCDHFYVLSLPLEQVLFEDVPSEHPKRLVRTLCLEPSEETKEASLVLFLERFAAYDGETIDVRLLASLDDFVLLDGSKFLAEIEVPRLRIETTRTMVAATADEKADSAAFAVNDTHEVDITVVH
jgi:hypothetical protein